jgi:hypothetical protein
MAQAGMHAATEMQKMLFEKLVGCVPASGFDSTQKQKVIVSNDKILVSSERARVAHSVCLEKNSNMGRARVRAVAVRA